MEITLKGAAELAAIAVALFTLGAIFIRQGSFIKYVEQIDKRLIAVEEEYLTDADNQQQQKTCRMEIFNEIRGNEKDFTLRIEAITEDIDEIKESISEICKDNKIYRRLSDERWIKTNEVLAGVSAILESNRG